MRLHWRSTVLLLALLLIAPLVGGCAAPSATPVPTVIPTPALDASGQPILKPVGAAAVTPSAFAGWKVSITKAGRATTISQPGLVTVEADGVFLILHVTATNGGKAASSFPLKSLSVKDAAGMEYQIDAAASDHYSFGAKLPDQGKSIAPKGVLELGVVFDVPPAATGLKLKVGTQEIAIQG